MGPTAELLAQHLLSDGFVDCDVPEVQRLATACDRLLTRHGMSVEMVCIIDRELNADRHFAVDALTLQEVARSCFKYSSAVIYNTKLPCTVQVIEIGPDAAAPENRSGLEKLAREARNLGTFFFSGWTVDPGRADVWSTAAFKGLLAGRRRMERIVRDRTPPQKRVPAVFEKRLPLATVLVIAGLVAAFAIEISALRAGAGQGIDIATLIALGGETRELVLNGEWYRVFTAALLHGDLLHLLLNCFALYLAGAFVERLVGWTWLVALFLAGALGGAALSLALNPPSAVSIGASSAIMGLLAAGLVLSGRLTAGKTRAVARNQLARFLIPSLIPLLTTPHFGGRIDYAGHLGGAIAGAAAGVAVLRWWASTESRPPANLGRWLASACAVMFLVAVARAGLLYPAYAHLDEMAPASALRAIDSNPDIESARVLRDFPHDPRSHWLRGRVLASQGKFPDAEKEFRAALAYRPALRILFKPQLQRTIESDLARVLVAENRADEARRTARLVCATPEKELLADTGLCAAR
jgi:rhomboid protease GluP